MLRTPQLVIVGLSALCLQGCANTSLIERPVVTLNELSVEKVDLDEQSFVLSFDVQNPNPFPLSIRHIRYGVELDGQRFASGQAYFDLNVPAASDSSFEVAVELNLLRTAPDLLFVVRDGVRGHVPYSLTGRFVMDMPTGPEVQFAHSGDIRLGGPEH